MRDSKGVRGMRRGEGEEAKVVAEAVAEARVRRTHLRVAPVALGVQVAELEHLLQAEADLRGRATDLPRHEVLACTRAPT